MRPLCLGTSGSVRATSMHHFASWANVVQTFWPVTRQPPFVLDRLGLQRREVGARLGLGEALAPDLLGGEDRLEEALLLLLGAVGDHDRAAHHEAEHVRRPGRLGARQLLAEDRLLDQRRAAAAVLLRPRDAGPAALVELALPLALELELRPGRRPAAPGPDGCRRARRAARRGTPAPRIRQRQVHGSRTLLPPARQAILSPDVRRRTSRSCAGSSTRGAPTTARRCSSCLHPDADLSLGGDQRRRQDLLRTRCDRRRSSTAGTRSGRRSAGRSTR